jgi:DNA-binding MarR family transcriptional regulator
MTPPMMVALLALAAGCSRASDVARHMGVDAAAVTRLMDRLIDAGLVGRMEPKGDRRSRSIELTPKALALLPELQAVAAQAERQLGRGLSSSQKAALIATLKALTRRAEQL